MDDDARIAAFSAFYADHYVAILRVCERRLSDADDAQDAAAEVFRVAWQRFDEIPEPGLPWLYAIARNVIGTEYRRRKRAVSLWERAAGVAVLEAAGPDGEDVELRAAMVALKPSERELLFLAYWEDLSGADIATILGCSVAQVWVRLSRARASLRKQLNLRTSEKAGR